MVGLISIRQKYLPTAGLDELGLCSEPSKDLVQFIQLWPETEPNPFSPWGKCRSVDLPLIYLSGSLAMRIFFCRKMQQSKVINGWCLGGLISGTGAFRSLQHCERQFGESPRFVAAILRVSLNWVRASCGAPHHARRNEEAPRDQVPI